MTSLGVQRGWICLCNFSASIAHELCERTCSTWQNASRRKSLEVSCSLVTKQLYMSCLTSVSFLRFVHHDSLKPICAFPHSCQVSCALQTTWLQTKGPRDRKAQDECTAGPSKSYLKPMWQIVRKSCNFVHLLQTHLTAANPAFLWFLMDINEFGQGYWLDLSVPRCSMLGKAQMILVWWVVYTHIHTMQKIIYREYTIQEYSGWVYVHISDYLISCYNTCVNGGL